MWVIADKKIPLKLFINARRYILYFDSFTYNTYKYLYVIFKNVYISLMTMYMTLLRQKNLVHY